MLNRAWERHIRVSGYGAAEVLSTGCVNILKLAEYDPLSPQIEIAFQERSRCIRTISAITVVPVFSSYRIGRVKVFIPGAQNIRFSRDSYLHDHDVVYIANRRGK